MHFLPGFIYFHESFGHIIWTHQCLFSQWFYRKKTRKDSKRLSVISPLHQIATPNRHCRQPFRHSPLPFRHCHFATPRLFTANSPLFISNRWLNKVYPMVHNSNNICIVFDRGVEGCRSRGVDLFRSYMGRGDSIFQNWNGNYIPSPRVTLAIAGNFGHFRKNENKIK